MAPKLLPSADPGPPLDGPQDRYIPSSPPASLPVRRRVTVPLTLFLALVANLVVAALLVAWLLPAPWGTAVLLLTLAQFAALRQGWGTTVLVLVTGFFGGLGAGVVAGAPDPRRWGIAAAMGLVAALTFSPPSSHG